MVKAWGSKGRAFKLPQHWMSLSNGEACSVDCYQKLKQRKRSKIETQAKEIQ